MRTVDQIKAEMSAKNAAREDALDARKKADGVARELDRELRKLDKELIDALTNDPTDKPKK